ncbi:MAG: hypothetical protein AABY93_11475 [Bacteroidota bacterium]
MKAIESTLIGRKAVLAKDPNIMRFQVQQILNAHRDTLINSLLKDVPFFLAYRFRAKATASELQEIESKLLQLKKGNVDIDSTYHSIVQQVKKKAITRLTNEIFYSEIEELLLSTSHKKYSA